MSKRMPEWFGLELDVRKNRMKLRRTVRWGTSHVVTPYWKDDFIDWLIYEGAIIPCGLQVKSIAPEFCTFVADAAGVQTEGICLDAVFRVETAEFTRAELKRMVHDFEFAPSGRRAGKLFCPERIVHLDWYYDGSHDYT